MSTLEYDALDTRRGPSGTIMTKSTDLSFGTILAERYELIGEVGRGGFGMVYRARQLNMSREVAIKVLPPKFMAIPDLVARFQREAQLASRLRHPNTITIHDYGQHENLLFIVMELLTGEDLADRLKRVKRLPLDEIVLIARQVLKSLQEAHEQGIVHRDLKPENIFLTQVGDDRDFVKVLDFGIAKIADPQGSTANDGHRQLTIAGSTVGTPTYMSPEQAAGEDVDPQTDLYALGVILYEMANGRAPFADTNPVKTMRAHLFDPIPSFTNQELRHTIFESVVLRALEKDRADRFKTASEFLKSLEQNLGDRLTGSLIIGPRTPLDDDTPTMEFIDPDSLGGGSSESLSPTSTTDSVDAILSDIPLFSANRTPNTGFQASPSPDMIPFGAPAPLSREPVRHGSSRSNLTETSDLGLALEKDLDSAPPPPGFDLKEGASISSILTIVEEPDTSEEDVIVLTRPKKITPKHQELIEPSSEEPSSSTKDEGHGEEAAAYSGTDPEPSGEWVWGNPDVKVEELIERSQELKTARSQGAGPSRRAVGLMFFLLVVTAIALGAAWTMGYIDL